MEKVNHPEHYNQTGKKECIKQMQDDYGRYITVVFCLTNAYKYLYRAGSKPDNSEDLDLQKAKWYFDYANNKLFSSINGSHAITLYRDVKEELKRRKVL